MFIWKCQVGPKVWCCPAWTGVLLTVEKEESGTELCEALVEGGCDRTHKPGPWECSTKAHTSVWAEALRFPCEWLLFQIFNILQTSRFHFSNRFFFIHYKAAIKTEQKICEPLPRRWDGTKFNFAACDFLQVQTKALKIKTIPNSELRQLFRTLLQLPKAVLDVPVIYSHTQLTSLID